MQSIEQRLHELVVEQGVPPDEATKLITEFQQEEANQSMAGRWCEPADSCSRSVMQFLWIELLYRVADRLQGKEETHAAAA
jgi:hypothetical protein